MSIQGTKREQKETSFTLKTGLFEANVIAINPDAEELKEKIGIEVKEDSKQLEYLGEREGNTTLRVDVWLQEVKSNDKFKVTFFLEDKEKENKDGSKKQYIDSVGTCSWAEDPNLLPDWFKKRDYRVANVGEEDLYNFMRVWLGNLDLKNADTVLQLEWKKLMKGNVKDLKDQIDGEFSVPVVALATVKTVIKDDETKEYQSIYNKGFLSRFSLKNFRLVNYSDEKIVASLRGKKAKDLKPHEKFVVQVTGEYGCKDFYVLREIKEYNPNENLVASDKVISTDGADF